MSEIKTDAEMTAERGPGYNGHHVHCECEKRCKEHEFRWQKMRERISELEAERDRLVKTIEERGYAFQEAVQKALGERDRLKAALAQIIRAIGGSVPECCAGGKAEIEYAAFVAKAALEGGRG